jgi:hypothetical protein
MSGCEGSPLIRLHSAPHVCEAVFLLEDLVERCFGCLLVAQRKPRGLSQGKGGKTKSLTPNRASHL